MQLKSSFDPSLTPLEYPRKSCKDRIQTHTFWLWAQEFKVTAVLEPKHTTSHPSRSLVRIFGSQQRTVDSAMTQKGISRSIRHRFTIAGLLGIWIMAFSRPVLKWSTFLNLQHFSIFTPKLLFFLKEDLLPNAMCRILP